MASTCILQSPDSAASTAASHEPPCQRRRVLHVISGEHYAGAERVQDLLALQLGEFGFEVGLACLKPGDFPKMRRSQHVPLYRVAMRSRWDLSPAWKLARIIRREGYELIHSHTARSALIAALASLLTGVPLVHHVHSPAAADSTHHWRNVVNMLVERIGLRRASALVAVSESLGRYIRGQGFPDPRVTVVPNGVPARAEVSRPTPKTAWTIGAMALFRPRKGLEVLLEAVARLRDRGLNVRLRAVGNFETPAYENHIRQLCKQLALDAAVDWTGFAQDVDRELAAMDLFVLPSLFGEGLPMVVLEAMSAGLPVVATRVEGVPEAIRDGRDGLLVAPGDATELADAIGRVVNGGVDATALGQNARQRHAERFSDMRMAAEVAAVYRRVLAQPSASR
jgi:glycosyltransferase involved in cell wall biosynthesis